MYGELAATPTAVYRATPPKTRSFCDKFAEDSSFKFSSSHTTSKFFKICMVEFMYKWIKLWTKRGAKAT